MTLSNSSERQAHIELVRPVPPGSHHSFTGKRFTVRDGFHLKTRNAETQAAIDAQLTARGESPDLPEGDDGLNGISIGPTQHEIASAFPLSTRVQSNNNLEEHHRAEAANRADEAKHTASIAITVLDQLRQPEYSNQVSRRRVRAALKAPAEWMIYRQHPSDTQQRKQRRVNKLLNEILQDPKSDNNVMDTKQDEVRAPRKPRCQSTLGSTYSQRVAAARPQKQQHQHNYHREVLQSLTETERGLLRSRENNNKAVDKLLVSLFHPPTASATPSTPMTLTNSFSTRRSVIRHETAVALRSRKLVSRMNELRSLPQLLEKMEALQVWKQQQHIAEYGEDIVARNRANPTLQILQKPSQTPLLPSATDRKVHQANKRKQELDAAKEENVRRIILRWHIHREQRTEQTRRIHVQSQWLLVVTLTDSSKKWLSKFHEFRQKRSVLVRTIMAQRLQRYWRQRILVKLNSLQLLHFTPSTPLSSAFYRMPVVIQAVTKLQQSIRDWLEQKHRRERTNAVAQIVTAWFEFQDVKFRRIILRFRKRVRDFQTMWRAWRAITSARIKLLFLVWANLERKIKRRHGVTASQLPVAFSLPNDPLQSKFSNDDTSQALPGGKGLTLLDMLQRTTVERPMSQHKQLEDMHRHFRNGGTVHMPISTVSPGSLGLHSPMSTNSPTVGFQASAPSPSLRKSNGRRQTENTHVRQDLQLRDNMGEEFQLVMYDVYTTRHKLSPSSLKSPARLIVSAAQTHDAKRSSDITPKSPPRGSLIQPPALQLPAVNPSGPAPPSMNKVPHHVKVTVLRKLLSEKRKMYSDTRDRGREAWAAARKQMRSEAFRYDVLDELAAFQQLQAKYATFLLLHSITETEMVRLIHQTQEEVHAAESAATTRRPSETHRKSVGGGPRKSRGFIMSTV